MSINKTSPLEVNAHAVFVRNMMHRNYLLLVIKTFSTHNRGRSRAAATSKMECFVIILNGWKQVNIITKHFILDVAASLDLPLHNEYATYFLII